MEKINEKSLRRFNLIMGVFHLIQGIGMLVLSLVWDKIINFTPAIYVNSLTYDPIAGGLVSVTQELFKLPFGTLVSSFLLISAFAHFLISIPKKTNNIYNSDLKKNINKFRWYEYAISSSIMIVLIATLFGVNDLGTLILIFLINASMNLFGLLMEKLNQNKEKVDWSPFVYGSIAGIASWIVIIINGFGITNLAAVPWFVYAIVITYFVCFNLFPINMILQYKKVGKWKNYTYGERVYIILSLFAKSALAWLVLFGVMQPVI